MARLIKILSIDGGGIRGIIPAMVMVEIEQRTGRRIADLFDLIAGTSTGGVLALGLTRPGEDGKPFYTAEDGVRLYEREGETIFNRTIWNRVRTLESATNEKYPSAGIESVLDRYFGETRLKDALTDVMITSYEVERRIPWFFRSARARVNPDYDFPMKYVARATTAAPTYFETARIDTDNLEDYYALIDGGVFANNPTMCAFVDARTQYVDAGDFLVVSLGTGQAIHPLPYREVKDWGMIGWVRPLIDILMHGVSDTVDYQMRQLLPYVEGGINRYYRFQVKLDEQTSSMDNVSPENLRNLKLVGEMLVQQQSAALEQLCRDLTRD